MNGNSLGDRYYTVQHNGEIIPKFVLELPFKLGESSFFETEDAVRFAIPLVANQSDDASLSTERRNEAMKRLMLMTKTGTSFLNDLQTRPVLTEQKTGLMRDHPVEIPVESIPKEGTYYLPGTVVYIAVTPDTYHKIRVGWRPALFFVLKKKIKGVYIRKFAEAYYVYEYVTRYRPLQEEIFATEDQAVEKIVDYINKFVPATPDRARIETHEGIDEEEFERNMHAQKPERFFEKMLD